MQNNIASTAQIIMTLSSSIHKMDKRDKIDVIEARQKSSENTMADMVKELRSEIYQIKTTTPDYASLHTPSYANVLKTSEKPNKNNTNHSGITKLEQLKPSHVPTSSTQILKQHEGESLQENDLKEQTKLYTDPTNHITSVPDNETHTSHSAHKMTHNKKTEIETHNPNTSTSTYHHTTTPHGNVPPQVPTYSPMDADQESSKKNDTTTATEPTLPTATHKY